MIIGVAREIKAHEIHQEMLALLGAKVSDFFTVGR